LLQDEGGIGLSHVSIPFTGSGDPTGGGKQAPRCPFISASRRDYSSQPHEFLTMTIADLSNIQGRTYPARRLTQNLVGGLSPIQATTFSMGFVTLDPAGGQVPWHCQDQEEIYFVLEGEGEMCLGEELGRLSGGQAVYIPSGVFHQLTNVGETPLKMIYAYGPAGDVSHWRQELDGSLPRAGIDVPFLPEGATPQHVGTGGER
jgi:mannose-6-phosphate isomerase-like protein (cupin superfamily)